MGWVRVLCSDYVCKQQPTIWIHSDLTWKYFVVNLWDFKIDLRKSARLHPKELCSVSWGIFMRCHMHIHFKPSIFGYPHDYGNLHIQSCFNDGKFCDTSCWLRRRCCWSPDSEAKSFCRPNFDVGCITWLYMSNRKHSKNQVWWLTMVMLGNCIWVIECLGVYQKITTNIFFIFVRPILKSWMGPP